MLWWLQGSDEDNKDGFCGHHNRLRTHILCDVHMGRLRTNRVLWWLQRLAKDQHGGFCVRWVRRSAHRF